METTWPQEDIDRAYRMLNSVYGKILMKKFPYIKKVEIDRESFDKLVNSEIKYFGHDVEVHMCVRYGDPEYDTFGGFGSYTTGIMNQLRIMLAEPVLYNKKMFVFTKSNDSEFCEGLLNYDYL